MLSKNVTRKEKGVDEKISTVYLFRCVDKEKILVCKKNSEQSMKINDYLQSIC